MLRVSVTVERTDRKGKIVYDSRDGNKLETALGT